MEMRGAGEVAQGLRIYTVAAEQQGLAPSIHAG